MSAMPERVWIAAPRHFEKVGVGNAPLSGWPDKSDGDQHEPRTCYVPESRLREVEAERKAVFHALHPECWARPGIPNTCTVEMCDCFDSHDFAQQIAALRAERDALVPLARLGLGGLDGGSYYLDYLVRLGVSKPTGKESAATVTARAILAAYDAAHPEEAK